MTSGACLTFVLYYFDPTCCFNNIVHIFLGLVVCSKSSQYQMYEELYFSLTYNELRYTEVDTGCLHPCSYYEYQIVDKQVHQMGGFGLHIAYGTLAVTVKREVQPPVYIFQLNKKNYISRSMITHLSRWFLTLEDLSVSSSASPSLAFGTSSNTGLALAS